MWVPILCSPILLSNILSSMSCICSSIAPQRKKNNCLYFYCGIREDQRNSMNDEQRIGTVCFEESDPLGQQSITVKHGQQPKADNGIRDMMEPGCSLSEHTQLLYFKFYTQSRIRLMLAQ